MMKSYPVHPLADIFPMMSDEEIAALAGDIKENGLIHAIMLDKDGEQLVDGRNRQKACEVAGVEPRYERLNGQEPRDYIASANLARRNMTKGQQAMALAMLYPEPEKGGRGKNDEARKARETRGFSSDRLRQARAVLRYSPELARRVVAGTEPLDLALAKVIAEQKAAQTDDAKLERLRTEAPDLADLVTDERMKVNEAVAALDERIETAKREQRTATEVIGRLFNVLHPRGAEPRDWAQRLIADVRAEYWPNNQPAPLDRKSLMAIAKVAMAMAEQWRD
jgi:hypothetical protein